MKVPDPLALDALTVALDFGKAPAFHLKPGELTIGNADRF